MEKGLFRNIEQELIYMEDTAETSWFSEMGMEDPFSTDQYDIPDFFDEELYAAFGEEHFQNSLSPQSNSFSSGMIPRNISTTSLCASSNMETPQNGIERPAKQHKLNNCNNSAASHEQASGTPIILSFGNSNVVPEKKNPQQVTIGGSMNLDDDHNSVSEVLMSRGSYTNLEEATKNVHSKKKTCGRSRPPSQTYDHIIAERRRREQLSQQFLALSAIVPGLKKMDKTSVLGESIKYLKHLQEREKELDEQATMQTMESMVLVKKSQLLIEDDEESSDEQAGCSTEQPLPEIEAKLCDKHVLLRILCEKHKGVLVKILLELEKLNLAVTNINVAPFGNLALDITIITEIRKDFNLSMPELVRILGSTLGPAKFQTV